MAPVSPLTVASTPDELLAAATSALVAAAFYLLLSGAEVATQRSFFMTAVVLIAVIVDRRAITFRTLAVAALIVLAIAAAFAYRIWGIDLMRRYLTPSVAFQAQAPLPGNAQRAIGCVECRDTGYHGRAGVYEIMQLSDSLKAFITPDTDLAAIRRQAFKEGMRSLRLSGAQKVAAGLTTIEEVLRVTPQSELK